MSGKKELRVENESDDSGHGTLVRNAEIDLKSHPISSSRQKSMSMDSLPSSSSSFTSSSHYTTKSNSLTRKFPKFLRRSLSSTSTKNPSSNYDFEDGEKIACATGSQGFRNSLRVAKRSLFSKKTKRASLTPSPIGEGGLGMVSEESPSVPQFFMQGSNKGQNNFEGIGGKRSKSLSSLHGFVVRPSSEERGKKGENVENFKGNVETEEGDKVKSKKKSLFKTLKKKFSGGTKEKSERDEGERQQQGVLSNNYITETGLNRIQAEDSTQVIDLEKEPQRLKGSVAKRALFKSPKETVSTQSSVSLSLSQSSNSNNSSLESPRKEFLEEMSSESPPSDTEYQELPPSNLTKSPSPSKTQQKVTKSPSPSLTQQKLDIEYKNDYPTLESSNTFQSPHSPQENKSVDEIFEAIPNLDVNLRTKVSPNYEKMKLSDEETDKVDVDDVEEANEGIGDDEDLESKGRRIRRESDLTESFKELEPFKYELPPIEEGKRERLYKVLVVGELGTGKTSIIKRYVHQFFSQHYRATIGVDFALKVLRWDPETVVRLQLWDIAGQERFGSMTRVYYKEAVGAFVVFDVTRSATLEAVPKWKADLDSKVVLPDGRTIPTVLLANKSDQQKEGLAANREKMNEFCQQQGFSAWFETSAKDNINIDESANFLVSKILEMDKWSQEPMSSDPEKIDLKGGTRVAKPGDSNCAC